MQFTRIMDSFKNFNASKCINDVNELNNRITDPFFYYNVTKNVYSHVKYVLFYYNVTKYASDTVQYVLSPEFSDDMMNFDARKYVHTYVRNNIQYVLSVVLLVLQVLHMYYIIFNHIRKNTRTPTVVVIHPLYKNKSTQANIFVNYEIMELRSRKVPRREY